MAVKSKGINIGTVSGGIVNFGGAVCIAPISTTQTPASSSGGNTGANTAGSTSGQGSLNLGSTSGNTGVFNGLNAFDRKMLSDVFDFLKTML